MSITWIAMISDFLMDFLNLLPVISPFNRVVLGISILAWGNSTGDLFAN